jgi:hypothetical protein
LTTTYSKTVIVGAAHCRDIRSFTCGFVGYDPCS